MLRRAVTILLVAQLTATVSQGVSAPRAAAQEVLSEPLVQIEGPSGQLVYLTVRYFSDRRLIRTVNSRLEITVDAEPFPLDFGYPGIHLNLTVPTIQPVTVKLLDGESLILAETSQSIGEITLEYGPLPTDTDWDSTRVLLNAAERQLVREFISGLEQGGSTRQLVSDLPFANIDWPTLDAYCQAVTAALGEPASEVAQLDGWLSWQGSLGARVLAGPIVLQRGQCHFTLMVIDGALVDVLVKSNDMPDRWFQGPSSETMFIESSLTLAKLLFEGQAERARDQFSRRYFKEVTVESLQELADQLSTRFGNEIMQAEFKKTELGDYDPESRSRILHVYHALNLRSGKRCISEVQVVFPCGPNIIARGHLASINVREAWQSAEPQLKEKASNFLNHILSGAESSAVMQLFHPQARAELDKSQLKQRLTGLPRTFDRLASQPDWDLWRGRRVGELVFVVGPIQFQEFTADVRLHFAEDQLLGGSVLSRDRAFFTMDLIEQASVVSALGRDFWRNVISGKTQAAYEALAPAFRDQFPLTRFEDLVSNSGIAQLEGLRSIVPAGVRFSEQLDRGLPVMIAAYFIAELEDEPNQPLRCDFRRVSVAGETTYELLRFNSEFEAVFPVSDAGPMQVLSNAFRTGDSSQLVQLLSEEDRSEVDIQVLDGFLRKLNDVLPDQQTPSNYKLLHDYSVGKRVEVLNCDLVSQEKQIPLTAKFQYGHLKSFTLEAPELVYFLDAINDDQVFRIRATEFLDAWMADDAHPALKLMVEELRTEETSERLRQLRTRLIRDYGEYQSAQLLSLQRANDRNRVNANCHLQFERGAHPVDLQITVDAFAARILGVDVADLVSSTDKF